MLNQLHVLHGQLLWSQNIIDNEPTSAVDSVGTARIEELAESFETLINHMAISRCFERIADLSTNIAEDVICLVSE